MNQAQIGENVKQLIENLDKENFIYDFLRAYDISKATITRLQKGDTNLSMLGSDVILKRKLLFRHEPEQDLHQTIDILKNDTSVVRHGLRFVIATDYVDFLAVDTKTQEGLDIKLKDLPKHFHFFLPWAGMEKTNHVNENAADVKAAEKMAKLFDLIREDNPSKAPEDIHALNVFLTRLLFCYFAEDTEIFEEQVFTNAISAHTQDDGSDLKEYLENLFRVLNMPKNARDGLPAYYDAFHYVNGGLFAEHYPVPKFSRKSRKMIIESGQLQWAEINPDIFGSMFQAVIDPEERGDKGMHYTSVPNIMKVIEPLFLNEIRDQFDKHFDNDKKLEQLLQRIYKLKIFDPACGSGNFLIIAYKELRTLEMEIFSRLDELRKQKSLAFSEIKLSQFYGIEIDDFAHEIAILALWLAEHQMNVKFKEMFGDCRPSLPLKEGGNIVCDNATRANWEEVCPKRDGDEIYILGNPPYLGSKVQDKSHKSDMLDLLSGFKKFKDLDYISCWFLKAAKFIQGFKAEYAFVTTNSICQGSQVVMLWPNIFDMGLEIGFAHKSFKWTNSAKGQAGVICSIIGIRNISTKQRFIFEGGLSRRVDRINGYLTQGGNVYIDRRGKPLSSLPKMDLGNMPIDGGNLILSTEEKNTLIAKHPEAAPIIKKLYGSKEFINGGVRWCLWITEENLELAKTIPEICRRIDAVRDFRAESKDKGTQKLATRPHQFREMKHANKHLLFVSRVSSERRHYIPIGLLDANSIVADAQVIYDAEYYIYALLCSRLHIVWLRAVGGRLKTDYRYSSALCYNNFPVPNLSASQKNMLTERVFQIEAVRQSFPEKTIAQLYDPNKMPDSLKEAHEELDLALERCYRSKPFTSDEERLEHLFKLYEEMTQNGEA